MSTKKVKVQLREGVLNDDNPSTAIVESNQFNILIGKLRPVQPSPDEMDAEESVPANVPGLEDADVEFQIQIASEWETLFTGRTEALFCLDFPVKARIVLTGDYEGYRVPYALSTKTSVFSEG